METFLLAKKKCYFEDEQPGKGHLLETIKNYQSCGERVRVQEMKRAKEVEIKEWKGEIVFGVNQVNASEEFLTTVSHCWIGFNVQLKNHPNISSYCRVFVGRNWNKNRWNGPMQLQFRLLEQKKRKTHGQLRPSLLFLWRRLLFLFSIWSSKRKCFHSLIEWQNRFVCSNRTNCLFRFLSDDATRKYHKWAKDMEGKIPFVFVLIVSNFIWIDLRFWMNGQHCIAQHTAMKKKESNFWISLNSDEGVKAVDVSQFLQRKQQHWQDRVCRSPPKLNCYVNPSRFVLCNDKVFKVNFICFDVVSIISSHSIVHRTNFLSLSPFPFSCFISAAKGNLCNFLD